VKQISLVAAGPIRRVSSQEAPKSPADHPILTKAALIRRPRHQSGVSYEGERESAGGGMRTTTPGDGLVSVEV
jgi:hypothetical protein